MSKKSARIILVAICAISIDLSKQDNQSCGLSGEDYAQSETFPSVLPESIEEHVEEDEFHEMFSIKHLIRGGKEYISFGDRKTTKKRPHPFDFIKNQDNGVNLKATCECNSLTSSVLECLDRRFEIGYEFVLCGYPRKEEIYPPK